MKVFICGQKTFGREVLKRLISDGHEVVGVAVAPQSIKKDKMVGLAMLHDIPVVGDCDTLTASAIPDETELIVAAHSHWIVSGKCLEKCKYGGIGYHPSILPLHRGRDAVRWAVKMGDRITGGTVYKLGDKCDGGEIIKQDYILIDPQWDYHDLWNALFPRGVDLVSDVVKMIENGSATYTEQDERFATFEPSWDRPRLRRNDLIMIG